MTEGARRIVAVVLNFRGWPGIEETLLTLGEQLPMENVVVVDNASDDGSVERISSRFPLALLISSTVNDGYASGMNLGIAATADAEFVAIVTHECVLEPQVLEMLVAELDEHPRAAIAAPLLGQRSTGKVWSAGGVIKRRSGQPRHQHAGHSVAALRATASRNVEWADGAALLLRRSALDEVGGLDERFFLYDEEVDLALRLRARQWTVRLVPQAVAWQEPGSGGMPVYLEVRNRMLLWRFNRQWLLAASSLAYSLWQIGIDLLGRNPSRAWLRCLGLKDACTGGLDRRRALIR